MTIRWMDGRRTRVRVTRTQTAVSVAINHLLPGVVWPPATNIGFFFRSVPLLNFGAHHMTVRESHVQPTLMAPLVEALLLPLFRNPLSNRGKTNIRHSAKVIRLFQLQFRFGCLDAKAVSERDHVRRVPQLRFARGYNPDRTVLVLIPATQPMRLARFAVNVAERIVTVGGTGAETEDLAGNSFVEYTSTPGGTMQLGRRLARAWRGRGTSPNGDFPTVPPFFRQALVCRL